MKQVQEKGDGTTMTMKQSFNKNSTIKQILNHPIGNDIIDRLLLKLNVNKILVDNILVQQLTLTHLKLLSFHYINDDFINTICDLLNQSAGETIIPTNVESRAWWKEAIFYQIYPRSFFDTDGDGLGDLSGIIKKLPYLQQLGVTAIWLSPIYDSPMDDMGYDIRDYKKIFSPFGTMEQFDQLLDEVHRLGMRLIMDLIVNHTSDEHDWFTRALHGEVPYTDFYISKPGDGGKIPPNNWTSFFSGSGWNYDEKQDKWYLHLFSKKQMDLNWESEALRQQIYEMVNWWLAKGIDGFRLDVINYISKQAGLPNGNEVIAKLVGYCGIEHYFYGRYLHNYLRELRLKTFEVYNAVTVGEIPGCGVNMSELLVHESRKELDMIFSFDHLESPGKSRLDDYAFDLIALKDILIKWQGMEKGAWNTLFFENHDNQRMISKVLGNGNHPLRFALGKMLAVIQLTLKGTPFIFQGEEIGMINCDFPSIDEFRDIESLNLYASLIQGGASKEDALKEVLAGSRDHARTPFQWDSTANGGFSTGTPWLMANPDYNICNVANQQNDPSSLLNFYKKLIALRKENDALIYGEFNPTNGHRYNLFCYYRILESKKYYIEINLTQKNVLKPLNLGMGQRKLLISNYDGDSFMLRPYEASIFLCQ